MKPLRQLCTPRDSVFDAQRRDTVLDLNDLVAQRIDPQDFFAENFMTEGMQVLLREGFRRLEAKTAQGTFLLKQAMGGGKTHSLLALGLLAKTAALREQVMGSFYTPDAALGPVQVVAFSGRESDAKLGIWGAIAEQLGNVNHFRDLYSPLRAPGPTAWQTLLQGRTVLILLDELPPYFDSVRAVAIGNSDLAAVTEAALSNLLVAIDRAGCERVCVVITDLSGAYQRGSGSVTAVLSDLEKETHRSAMSLEPVRMGSDELYQILRTRLFATLPAEAEVDEVAQAYAKAIKSAAQMEITSESPEQFAQRIRQAYPFHPSIRDLYARFRENPGFQQTRGLIRLMRIVTSRLWNSGAADRKYLIAAHDVDLNDPETLSEVAQINNTLGNAIAHDIASNGTAVAEIMDANLGGSDTQDAARLLLMASLANVPNAIQGLAIPEIVAYLCGPGRDVARLKGDVLEKLATAAWYLHSNRDGKLYFRNVENLNAKLESLTRTYVPEQAVKELRERILEIFKPVQGWCYQRVLVFPALDEIELDQDKVTLVVSAPQPGAGLRPELKQFWEQATWKNRAAFLTGTRDTYTNLVNAGRRMRAIRHILDEMARDKVADNDPQLVQAKELESRVRLQFHSAARETFTRLWYPTRVSNADSLITADFPMRFEGNKYDGEKQILDILSEKKKFEKETTSETFRMKCEQRLFGTQVILWNEVKKRAAMNPAWQWHHPDALDALKQSALHSEVWREQDGFIDKGPFPAPSTDVTIQELNRNDEMGEVTLRVTAVNGDTIYYDVGSDASTASAKLGGNTLATRDLRLSFLAVDSTGQHQTGKPKPWQNRITIRHRIYQSGTDRMMQLLAAPPVPIRYTTNGASPKYSGATFDGDFVIPQGTQKVLVWAAKDGVEADTEIAVPKVIDDPIADVRADQPAEWRRRHSFSSTKDSYEFLNRLTKYNAQATGLTITIAGEGADKNWLELTSYEGMRFGADMVGQVLELLRTVQTTGQVALAAQSLHFDQGLDLLAWVEDAKLSLKPGEVKQ